MSQTLFDLIWSRHVVTERDDGTVLLCRSPPHARGLAERLCHAGDHEAQRRAAAALVRLCRSPGPDGRTGPRHRSHRERGRPHDGAHPGRQLRRRRDRALRDRSPRPGHRPRRRAGAGPDPARAPLVCGNSAGSRPHGAFGALAFGIGASEVAHVLATQTLWQRRPRNLLVRVDEGVRAPAWFAKGPRALALIGRIGAAGGTGNVHRVRWREDRRALAVDARMTVSNMSIEAGARSGLIAPDEKTFAYSGPAVAPAAKLGARRWRLAAARPAMPGAAFDAACARRRRRRPDALTWGTSPEDVVSVTGVGPRSGELRAIRAARRRRNRSIIWACAPGRRCGSRRSSTSLSASAPTAGSRISRRRGRGRGGAVARRVRAGRPGLARSSARPRPRGSTAFHRRGIPMAWSRVARCASAMNGESSPGERCASTSNRNFEGRQGPGAAPICVSPATAAASRRLPGG